ncbi:hypothetical protein Glove_215g18 [Diversispora epigaea]|uniref:Inner centromere protein ARK-binding domain-containing protein n=1 Tax=Diversispora epigaea TaxID=1348612 RepID=A0A397IQG3_9GLOM|nr:hypothetical protein Glove_215g18 [Diversispora epigaea]
MYKHFGVLVSIAVVVTFITVSAVKKYLKQQNKKSDKEVKKRPTENIDDNFMDNLSLLDFNNNAINNINFTNNENNMDKFTLMDFDDYDENIFNMFHRDAINKNNDLNTNDLNNNENFQLINLEDGGEIRNSENNNNNKLINTNENNNLMNNPELLDFVNTIQSIDMDKNNYYFNDENNSDNNEWASEPNLSLNLQEQAKVNPEKIFGRPGSINIEEIFNKDLIFILDGDLGDWSPDPEDDFGDDKLTEEEIKLYNQIMGYEE